MKQLLTVAGACLIGGFAAATWWQSDAGNRDSKPTATVSGGAFDASQPVADRIAALERAVSDERLARQLLQEEVFYLTSELERLVDPAEFESTEPIAAPEASVSAADTDRRSERRYRNSAEGRKQQLVDAGFLPAQADWILRREQELQMEALQARFNAERSGEPVDWAANRSMPSDTLRAELGDDGYEQYLDATGRSTNVAVSSVIESSPAQSAGLQPGDEIVRYDGERVFSMTDLTRQTMVGEPGETVVVDIMRNGNLMQVALPRGPVGITGGRRRY